MTPVKTMIVSAIENGTVIDHLKAGQGLKIVELLGLARHKKGVSVGLNLASELLGLKDLVKVEDRELIPEEANQIALLSPRATVSIIKDFAVIEKYRVEIPETISRIFTCANPRCITNHEEIASHFHIVRKFPRPKILCHYCNKTYEAFDDYH